MGLREYVTALRRPGGNRHLDPSEGLNVLRVAASAAATAFLLVGCSTEVEGAAHPDPVVMQEIAACDAATDGAVAEGLAWLGDLEIRGGDADPPDTEPFTALGQACRNNPRGWPNFIVRTHERFEPVTLMGEVAARQFLSMACTQDTTAPEMTLTPEARRVCAGG